VKTNGQILYEHKSPPRLPVVHAGRARFATSADVFTVPNDQHVPWQFLTERCRLSWEQSAVGHYLFSRSES
jgi:hypothetical protein